MLLFYTVTTWVLASSIARPHSVLKNNYISKFTIFLFSALLLSFIPFRDYWSYGGDMVAYINNLQKISQLSLLESLKVSSWEPMFIVFQWTISRLTSIPSFFIFISTLLYIVLLYKVIKKMFLPWQYIFVFFGYLNFTFFYGYIFNAMRQGIAMMLLLLFIAIIIESKENRSKLKIALIAVASVLFHYSAIPCVLLIIFLMYLKVKLKSLVMGWIALAIMFLMDFNRFFITLPVIRSISFLQDYNSESILIHYGGLTNNPMFLLFSALILCISLVFYYKVPLSEENKITYTKLLKVYITLNIYFLMFGFISFSDRIAAYSWFMIPMLILYPVLNSKKNNNVLLVSIVIGLIIVGFVSVDRFYTV